MEFDKYVVGNVIKRIRKERKLSQEVLSGLAGLARSHLTMIESGKKQANFETVWHIANALEISPHILVKYIDTKNTIVSMIIIKMDVRFNTLLQEVIFKLMKIFMNY